ncbi:hypothetical protein [Labilibaculum manganireducens]|nr:hypothetical protein [Labilibaculum manganireducens]
MKFEYPIPIKDPKAKLGQANTLGFYPIGRLFNWHGGLHVSENSNSPIKAIADGTVIAYRMPNLYPENTAIAEGIKYSNGFVLIQHKYKSPKKREFTFYSLYNHLMSHSELIQMKKIPDIFKTQQYKVKGKLACKGKGITAYKSISKSFSMILPVGSILVPNSNTDIFDSKDKHWAKKTEFKKVIFTDPDSGMVYSDLYVDLSIDQIEKLTNETYKVIGDKEEGKCWDYENLRSAPNWKDDNNVVMQVPNNSKCTIVKENKGYYEIKTLNGKDQKGFIYAKSCTKDGFVLNLEQDKLDKIITEKNCNIPVKAGEIIGFSGMYGCIKNINYRTAHIEIFTDKDPSDFLKGKEGDKDDVADTKKFLKFTKGGKLSLKFPIKLSMNDEIEVIDFPEGENEKYCRIKLHKQIRDVDYDDLVDHKKKDATGKSYYTPKNLTNLNAIFGDSLKEKSVVHFEEMLADVGKKKRRKISFTVPNDEHIYWVEKPTDINKKTTSPILLKADLATVYYRKPKNDLIEVELNEDYIEAENQLKPVKTSENTTWYQLKITDRQGQQEGYIESKDSTKISAHDWIAFGFKTFKDQSDDFVFDPDEKTAPKFLKEVWEQMDTKRYENGEWVKDTAKDGKLSRRELLGGLNDCFVSEKLSKMICYHTSEWSVDFNKLKAEIETDLDKNINKEQKPERKEKLKQQKEELLQITEEKVKALNFWKDIKVPIPNKLSEMPADMIYDPIRNQSRKRYPWERDFEYEQEEKEEEEYTPFPTSPKVYHFHPIAFVEQMRRMNDLTSPPWMDIALTEAKKAKYVKETLSPTSEMANKYHTYVGLPKATGSTAWCSSFVSWCLGEADQKNSKSAGSQSVLWNEGKLFKRIKEPVYGCIVLMTNYVKSTGKSNSHGHVTFLYGVDDNGDLICLGGNQGNRLKYSRYYFNKANSTFTQKGVKVEQRFNGYFLPVDFPASNSKQPEIVDIKKLNNELAGKAVKSNVKNEKTT